MIIKALILLVALSSVFVDAFTLLHAAPAEEKVRFSVAAITGSYMDEFVAIEKGYHRDEGLTVEMIRAGGGIATQALIAGDLHFSTSAGSALSAMLRGAEVKVVYTNIDRPGYQLWSGHPEIKTLKDLIGKKVGVTSRGDTQELSVRLLLRKYGINANSVVYIPVGFGGTRLAALQAGTVDAVPLGAGDFAQLKQPKGHMIGDAEKEIRFAYVGLAVSSRLLARQPNLVERYLRAVIKGREYAKRYRADDSDHRQIHPAQARVQRVRLRFDRAGVDARGLGFRRCDQRRCRRTR
jgi:ABC-type nitrate/sulfonate/bicarbonate transport system substrate-binding protein